MKRFKIKCPECKNSKNINIRCTPSTGEISFLCSQCHHKEVYSDPRYLGYENTVDITKEVFPLAMKEKLEVVMRNESEIKVLNDEIRHYLSYPDDDFQYYIKKKMRAIETLSSLNLDLLEEVLDE